MTPNLRYNKNLTRKLVKASNEIENRATLQHINWHLDNETDKVFGLQRTGWFKSATFFLQRTDSDVYRLIACDNKPLCGFFIIDDIERFIEVVGITALEISNPTEIQDSLKATKQCPNTGIIVVDDEGSVYLYEHSNY